MFRKPRWLTWPQRIERKLEQLMTITDDIKAAQAETDAKVAAVKTDVETLIAKLGAIVPSDPNQEAALQDILAHANAINASLSAVDAEANPPSSAG